MQPKENLMYDNMKNHENKNAFLKNQLLFHTEHPPYNNFMKLFENESLYLLEMPFMEA